MRFSKRVLPGVAVVALAAVFAFRRLGRQASRRQEEPADPAFMLAMHDAFRRDLARLVAQADAPTEHTVAGWELLARQLDRHHRAEDEDLWPALREHVRSPAIDAMEREHAEVPPALAAVQQAVDRGDPFGPEARGLQQLVLEHLEHEERDVLPLVADHLDAQEWRHWLLTERSKHGPRERVEFLSWVLDDANGTDTDAVLRELPPPGRVVFRRMLEPRYRRRHLWAAA
jgi:hypothetical protein